MNTTKSVKITRMKPSVKLEMRSMPEAPSPENETYISREETMAKLDVSSATLWRWKKNGYLVPVQLGHMDRYRLSDINNIITLKGGAL